MITINLCNLEFHAYHGVYEQERILGNQFLVSVSVKFPMQGKDRQSIEDTINYEEIFRLIERQMKQPEELLENLVSNIGVQLRTRFPRIQYMKVEVTKKNPPVSGWRGDVRVDYEWNAY